MIDKKFLDKVEKCKLDLIYRMDDLINRSYQAMSDSCGLLPNYNDDEEIWRYMNMSKFIALLECKKIHLTRLDIFDDLFEAHYPIVDYDRHFSQMLDIDWSIVDLKRDHRNLMELLKQGWFYVNCWHVNSVESYAMWNIYTTKSEGIAIKTTIGKLKQSIKSQLRIFYSKISYLDYNNESLIEYQMSCRQKGVLIHPFPAFYKEKSYEYEKEFRVAFMNNPFIDKTNDSHKAIDVNLDTLIEEIYISPYAGKWFRDLIEKVVKRYKLNAPIQQSRIMLK
jgi:hypothetical protein